jgi:endonuclease YncB( thermonuclease family)
VRRLLLVAVAFAVFAAATPAVAQQLPVEDYRAIPIRETGTVVQVADGDTILFRADGSDEVTRVRLLGINTPEVRGFEGQNFDVDQCGGPQASELLASVLPPGTRVQMRSMNADVVSRGRLQRYAFAFNPQTGEFDIDPQAIVARAGLAMWFTIRDEAALSATYRLLIEQAQLERLGIWNPEFCGPVEQPDAQLSVIVNWDAPGNDALNVNGESMIVRNIGSTSVDLSGWLLRDSSLEGWYTFPGGQVLTPNDYRVVFVGQGESRERSLYLGSPTPIFANVRYRPFIGDGAYLLDRATAVRAYFQYPCVVDCDQDPLLRRVAITMVQPFVTPGKRGVAAANEEYIDVTNISRQPVLMDGAFLRVGAATYPFLANTVIAPGKRVRVRIGQGTPTRRVQYWGRPRPLLPDRGAVAQLLSARNVEISRFRWGR